MKKHNYFSIMMRLADSQMCACKLLESVFCGECKECVSSISDINRHAVSLISESEIYLIDEREADFDREAVLKCMHGLGKIIGEAFEVSMLISGSGQISKNSFFCEEIAACREMSEYIYELVCSFDKKSSPSFVPDTYAFRLCMNKGRGAHSIFSSRLNFSETRGSFVPLAMAVEGFRKTENKVYDTLIEITAGGF